MATPSKQKGSAFEKKTAEAFSKRLIHIYGSEKSFITNVGSGSRFGGQNAKFLEGVHQTHHLVGDITPPDDRFKFVLECKHYKDPVTFMSIVKGKVANWDNWIKQVETDAKSTGKMPMLIIKYNLVPEIVILRSSTLTEDLPPRLIYGDYNVYTFEDILNLSDEFFISKEG